MTTHGPEPVDGFDHVRGATEAELTIIEYGDYDCPHTRRAQWSLDELLRVERGVRLVFRHFPLCQHHANAEKLARVAEAAELQDRFWPMHDRLMHHATPVTEGDLTVDAEAAGVDLERVAEAMEDEEVVEKIQHDFASGRRAGVHSTPTFFIEGALHDGSYDLATLRAKLEEARQRRHLSVYRRAEDGAD